MAKKRPMIVYKEIVDIAIGSRATVKLMDDRIAHTKHEVKQYDALIGDFITKSEYYVREGGGIRGKE